MDSKPCEKCAACMGMPGLGICCLYWELDRLKVKK